MYDKNFWFETGFVISEPWETHHCTPFLSTWYIHRARIILLSPLLLQLPQQSLSLVTLFVNHLFLKRSINSLNGASDWKSRPTMRFLRLDIPLFSPWHEFLIFFQFLFLLFCHYFICHLYHAPQMWLATTPSPLDHHTMTSPEEQWQHLIGQTIVSKADVTEKTDKQFYKEDLPEPNRVLGPTSICTRDFRMDRLNVNVDDKGVCQSVHFG